MVGMLDGEDDSEVGRERLRRGLARIHHLDLVLAAKQKRAREVEREQREAAAERTR